MQGVSKRDLQCVFQTLLCGGCYDNVYTYRLEYHCKAFFETPRMHKSLRCLASPEAWLCCGKQRGW
jgi:hypothetical protein